MQYDKASMDEIAKQIAAGYHDPDHNHGTKMVNEAIDSMFELYQYGKKCKQNSWCDPLTGRALTELSKELRKEGILKEGEAIVSWDPQFHNFTIYDNLTSRAERMTSRDATKRFDPRSGEPIPQLSDAERHRQAQEATARQQEEAHRRQQQQLQQDRHRLEQDKAELARREQELAQREREQQAMRQRQQQEEERARQRQLEERERRR